ncbi:MAG: hypothetical protein KAG95_04500 [Bacteroidales bacterium]|nr:hypothetical protein [Bacteroidales bacterium]
MKKTLIALTFFLFINNGIACTTAIISGKHTKDGRSMIWKLRDSDYEKNKMIFFADGKYKYIGLVNSKDIKGNQIWGGANSESFAIMNSASYNVNINDTSSKKDLEGYFMKLALQKCATLKDFENLLDTLSKPMGLSAHFGVIDGRGGAAFYEVNNYNFTKFNANNSAQAPYGYIIRTNYSFSGKKDAGYGYIRYQTAQNLFYQAGATNELNYKTIIQKFSRCFKHPILNKDFREEYKMMNDGEHFINSEDLITRNSSVSAILVQGAKAKEAKNLATIWTIVGYPNTCIALPLWVRGGENLPNVLVANKLGNSPLNNMSLILKKECYPITRASGNKYLQISKLINSDKTGIIQKIEPVENKIFEATEKKLKQWRKSPPKQKEIKNYYNELDSIIIETYSKNFGIVSE